MGLCGDFLLQCTTGYLCVLQKQNLMKKISLCYLIVSYYTYVLVVMSVRIF